ncbi:hypothetical protein EMIT0P171_50004 [Pseudomonas sp. IT-P171]
MLQTSWTADSVPVQKIAKLTGANTADVPELLAGSAFPDAKAQQTTALLDGGTAKAMGETAKFLKEQGKVETVLPDYSPYIQREIRRRVTHKPCGEGACSRWGPKDTQTRQRDKSDITRLPVLGLLRSPAGASSLATKACGYRAFSKIFELR